MQAGTLISVKLRAARPDGSLVRGPAIAAFFAPGKDPEHVPADRVPDREVPLSFDEDSRTYGGEVSIERLAAGHLDDERDGAVRRRHPGWLGLAHIYGGSVTPRLLAVDAGRRPCLGLPQMPLEARFTRFRSSGSRAFLMPLPGGEARCLLRGGCCARSGARLWRRRAVKRLPPSGFGMWWSGSPGRGEPSRYRSAPPAGVGTPAGGCGHPASPSARPMVSHALEVFHEDSQLPATRSASGSRRAACRPGGVRRRFRLRGGDGESGGGCCRPRACGRAARAAVRRDDRGRHLLCRRPRAVHLLGLGRLRDRRLPVRLRRAVTGCAALRPPAACPARLITAMPGSVSCRGAGRAGAGGAVCDGCPHHLGRLRRGA